MSTKYIRSKVEKEAEMEKISCKDVYDSLVQLTIHAENNAWERFNSYLLGNSILILAWATILNHNNCSKSTRLVLYIICIFGIIGSLAFSILGNRGRAFLSKYLEMGSYIEGDSQCWEQKLNQKFKPLSETKSFRDNLGFRWCGGRNILVFGPIVFVFFYAFLFCIIFLNLQ